jgi:hypothetical protein
MRTQYELAETTLALRWSAPSVGAAVRDACEQLGLPRASQDDAHRAGARRAGGRFR